MPRLATGRRRFHILIVLFSASVAASTLLLFQPTGLILLMTLVFEGIAAGSMMTVLLLTLVEVLSFMRLLLRRMKEEMWKIQRVRFDLDVAGYGRAVYEVHTPDRQYSLAAFANPLADHGSQITAASHVKLGDFGATIEGGWLSEGKSCRVASLFRSNESRSIVNLRSDAFSTEFFLGFRRDAGGLFCSGNNVDLPSPNYTIVDLETAQEQVGATVA